MSEPSDDVDEGRVIRTDPPEGEEVGVQDPITVVVSGAAAGGSATTEAGIAVPFVIGDSEANARQAITDAGLEVEVVYIDRPAGDQYDDEVMDQSPRVPARLAEGEVVTINVGRAADPPPTHPAATHPADTDAGATHPAAAHPAAAHPAGDHAGAADDSGAADDDERAMTEAGPLWGKQTELAIGNFPIAERPLDVRVARALATIKRHAAVVNLRLGVDGLDAEMVTAIGDAARQVESGELDESFPVDVYQTGSGTSTNMNVNEVIATLASQALGRPVHPNDHVNASQSSNDVVPTAIRLAAIATLAGHTHPRLDTLVGALRDLSERTMGDVKAGRTHLMDATPVTIGQEADAWAGLLDRALQRSRADLGALGELPLGGTAVGTGINAPTGFASEVVAAIAAETGFELRTTPNPMIHQGGQGALAEASSGLRGVAVALTKIANDVRLLASGPAAGLGELLLPELQAGSSIMPGKVNPVLCESVNQVAARVLGNDVTVGYAASQGILELNTYLPVMADALLESATLLGNVAAVFAERCVAGIEVDQQRTRGYAERTSALATALNPLIGYERAAAIVKQAQASGRSIIDVVVAEGVLSADEAKRVLDPLRAAGLG